jgi:hypothetical protein
MYFPAELYVGTKTLPAIEAVQLDFSDAQNNTLRLTIPAAQFLRLCGDARRLSETDTWLLSLASKKDQS